MLRLVAPELEGQEKSPTLGRSRSKFGLTAGASKRGSDKDSKKAATVLRLVAPELKKHKRQISHLGPISEQVWADGRCGQERV